MATSLTYTVRDLVTATLRKIGVVSAGVAPTANEMADAIVALNMMLKALQIPSITAWKWTTGSITLTDATLSYIIASRPFELGVVSRRDTNGLDLPLLRVTREAYFDLPNKDSGGTPTQFYYQREIGQGQLFVWPVMTTASGTIEWSGKAEINDVASPNDAIDVPAEWYEAIVYQLASRLCDDYEIDAGRQSAITARAERALLLAQHSGRESVYFMPERYA